MIETHILLGLCVVFFMGLVWFWYKYTDLNAYRTPTYPRNTNVKTLADTLSNHVVFKLLDDRNYKGGAQDQHDIKESVYRLVSEYIRMSDNIRIPSDDFYKFAFDSNKGLIDLKQAHESEWDKLHNFAAFLSLCNDYSENELIVLDHRIDLTEPGPWMECKTPWVSHRKELNEALSLIHSAEKQYIEEHKSDIINRAKNNLLSQCIITKPVDEKVEKLREIIENEKNANGTT